MLVPCSEKEIEIQVDKLLIKYGVNRDLKGYQYMKDIVLLGYAKKYSYPKLVDYFEEIANKYNIKPFSIQRQLRYAVTLQNIYNEKVTPEEILRRANMEIKSEKEVE